MMIEGVSDEVGRILDPVSKINSVKDYILIGGTSLSLQLYHRLSQDLDFCQWSPNKKTEVNWPEILAELKTIFRTVEPDILDFNQVNFLADNIKLSFYSNHLYNSPVTKPIVFLNNIRIPDIETIGVMKLEVMLRRSSFRDYYDIYSILKQGISLRAIVSGAIRYSNHTLKTRDILNFISSGKNFRKDEQFDLLKPKFQISEKDIEAYLRSVILNEFK